MSPPARRPSPKIAHPRIVEAQQDLLKWCPNTVNLSKEDLEYTCWACGGRSTQSRMTRCHITPFQEGHIDDASNFVLLCDFCHREQPDSLTRDVLKYWLFTREPEHQRNDRLFKVLMEALNIMKDEFGEVLVNAAVAAFMPIEAADMDTIRQRCLRYSERSAAQGTANVSANVVWGPLQDIQDWCVRKRQAVEEMQRELERCIDANQGTQHRLAPSSEFPGK